MKKFKRMYIEITNICNLSCSFCPKTKRKMEFLSVDNFKIILEKIKPYTEYIYFHLMGEPLLNPNLEEFLEIAYEKGFKVNITTNGTLLKKTREILLKSKSLRQINISLHSFEANDNNITFDEYFNEITSFVNEANEKTNIICALRLWNLESYNERVSSPENLDKNKRVKIRKNLYLNGAEKFQWPDINLDIISEKGFCHGLRDHIGILVDGTVVPCCLDSEGNIPLGNIYNKTLEEIINSERAINLYNGFSQRKKVEDLCKKCGYSERF